MYKVDSQMLFHYGEKTRPILRCALLCILVCNIVCVYILCVVYTVPHRVDAIGHILRPVCAHAEH